MTAEEEADAASKKLLEATQRRRRSAAEEVRRAACSAGRPARALPVRVWRGCTLRALTVGVAALQVVKERRNERVSALKLEASRAGVFGWIDGPTVRPGQCPCGSAPPHRVLSGC